MFRDEYLITFMDADGNELETRAFPNWITREEAWEELDKDSRTVADGGPWPVGAENIRSHSRPVKLVSGVDFGPGSAKVRFGGGRAPRGAYQFRG